MAESNAQHGHIHAVCVEELDKCKFLGVAKNVTMRLLSWMRALVVLFGGLVLLWVFAVDSRDGGGGGDDTDSVRDTGHHQAYFVTTETGSGSGRDGVYSVINGQLVSRKTETGDDDGTGGAVGDGGTRFRPRGHRSVSGEPKQVTEIHSPHICV